MNTETTEKPKESLDSLPKTYGYFGLYDNQTRTALPLQKIRVKAKINDYIAEVTYSQTYYNHSDTLLEIEYFFPISSAACFNGFWAKYENTIIQGEIKEKEEAKEEYIHHKKRGDVVAYADIADECYSVMSVKIGNLPPCCSIKIKFSYIERLDISLNKYWRFTLYSSLVSNVSRGTADTATSPQHDNSVLGNYPVHAKEESPNGKKSHKWDIRVIVDSRSPIKDIKCTSHSVEIVRSETPGLYSAKICLSTTKEYSLNKDFVLLYTTESINQPNYLLSPFKQGYCTLINFFPKVHIDDSYMASLEGKDLLEDLANKSKAEFIFIIETGRMMQGSRMNLAIQALSHFIQSLPPDSYFNIIFLGETITSSKSIRTTEETKQEALKRAGGSPTSTHEGKQIIDALDCIGKTEFITGYSRVIFLLTSGELDIPTPQLTQAIKDKLFKTKVFVLGIGHGSLTDLVRKVAVEGYGAYEIVREQSEVPEKVSHLLKSSTAPHFTDFELKIKDEKLFSYVVPLPKMIGCITHNELVEFFVIFNKKFEEIGETVFNLKFFNAHTNEVEEFEETIHLARAEKLDPVVKLGMLKFCESLLKKKEIYEAMGGGEIVQSFKEDVEKKLLATSLEHGILTSQTAFICKVKEADDTTRQIPTGRVIMSTKYIDVIDDEATTKPSEEFKPRDLTDSELAQSRQNSKTEKPAIPLEDQGDLLEDDGWEKEDDDTDNGPKQIIDRGGEEDRGLDRNTEEISASATRKHKFEDDSPYFDKSPQKQKDRSGRLSVDDKESKEPEESKGVRDHRKKTSPIGKDDWELLKARLTMGKAKSLNLKTKDSNGFNLGARKSRNIEKKNIGSNAIPTSYLIVTPEVLSKMIVSQRNEGYWDTPKEVHELLGLELNELMDKMPAGIKALPIKEDTKQQLWLTLLVVVLLERFGRDESEWKPAYDKGVDWLKKKEKDYYHYFDVARDALRF